MKMSIPVMSRESKYCEGIRTAVKKFGHATNAMILAEVQREFPSVSATTIHRATTRLAARGELMPAPADLQGAMRYEINKPEHDHFLCTSCGQLRDVDILGEITKILRKRLKSCEPSGRVVVSGICGLCH